MYNKKEHIHFVGIGGIGMSGIATVLRYQGYEISGCDVDLKQKSIEDLRQIGCTIHAGNNTSFCADKSIDILVYSSAIMNENPEILSAQKRGIPTIPRALMLAELMRTKYSIAIAGSHGKTTTTSLISHILLEAKMDPTIIIGGHLKAISSNARIGAGDFLVAEADESDRSITHLQASLAVVTNIDLEHLETYRDLDDIKGTFAYFLNNLPFYGKAVLCADDPNIQSLLPLPHVKTVLYGLSKNANFSAHSIDLQPDSCTFELFQKNCGHPPTQIHLPMPGKHNVLNALAACALTHEIGVPLHVIKNALATFKGVERRFTYRGTYKQAEIFDDYGHHPKEIEVTLDVARKRAKNKLTVVFQPHRYSRTHKLWNTFLSTFENSQVDHLIITDIYPASEEPIPGTSAEQLVAELKKRAPHLCVSYIPFDQDFVAIKRAVDIHTTANDLILLLGAGKINRLATHLT